MKFLHSISRKRLVDCQRKKKKKKKSGKKVMRLGHNQLWESRKRSFGSIRKSIPALSFPGWSRGSGVGAAAPTLAGQEASCCNSRCAPAEGSSHQGKKVSRESASHGKEGRKKARKLPGFSAFWLLLGEAPPERGGSFHLCVHPSIHPSIGLFLAGAACCAAQCLEEQRVRSDLGKKAHTESLKLRAGGRRETSMMGSLVRLRGGTWHSKTSWFLEGM